MAPQGIPDYEGPFAALLGIKALECKDGMGRLTMPVKEDLLQKGGVVQGGLIVALADHSMYLAVRSRMSEGETTVTIELKVNFIAGARDGELFAESHIVSRGNRIIVGEMHVEDDRGTLIAKGMGTFIVRPGNPDN